MTLPVRKASSGSGGTGLLENRITTGFPPSDSEEDCLVVWPFAMPKPKVEMAIRSKSLLMTSASLKLKGLCVRLRTVLGLSRIRIKVRSLFQLQLEHCFPGVRCWHAMFDLHYVAPCRTAGKASNLGRRLRFVLLHQVHRRVLFLTIPH